MNWREILFGRIFMLCLYFKFFFFFGLHFVSDGVHREIWGWVLEKKYSGCVGVIKGMPDGVITQMIGGETEQLPITICLYQ